MPIQFYMESYLKSLWVPVSAAIAQQRKVETIANNVANTNTPSFKKDDVVFKEYLTILNKGPQDIDIPRKEWAPKDFYRQDGAEDSKVSIDGTYTDFQQGQLTPTGNPFDLGIRGNGFIEILTPNGIRYTRDAILSISKDGDLVTNRGNRVLSKIDPNKLDKTAQDVAANADSESSPVERIIKIPANGKFSVNLDGEIFVNNQNIAKISLIEFNDIQALKKEGSSLFVNNDNKNIIRDDVKSSIHQGFVEQSNVNPIYEMSELIKAHRHFESIQKVIKTYDSMAQKSANEIANF